MCPAGDGISSVRASVILALGAAPKRQEFVDFLHHAPGHPMFPEEGAVLPVPDTPPPWFIRTSWKDPLPPVRWFRFDVQKVGEEQPP